MKIRLAAAVLTAASILLAGCEEAHVHQYASEITVPASCAEDGTVRFSCSCGDSYTEPVPASGHAWDGGAVTEEPDCMTAGVRLFACTLCDETKSEPIPPDGRHQYLTSVIEKPATCTEDGLASSSCSVCGEKITTAIAAVGQHSFGEAAVSRAATCGAAGESIAVCTACGEKKTTEIPADGIHSWDGGSVTVAASCTKEGARTYRCTVCSESRTESIPKNNVHSWSAGKITRAATCGTAGESTATCTACGQTKTAAIAQTSAHSWDSGAVITPATCTAEGSAVYTCIVCHTQKTDSVPQTGEHTWVTTVTKEPTVFENGEKTTACSVCGTVSRRYLVEKLQGVHYEPYRVRVAYEGDCYVEFTLDGNTLRVSGLFPKEMEGVRIELRDPSTLSSNNPMSYTSKRVYLSDQYSHMPDMPGSTVQRLSHGNQFTAEISLDEKTIMSYAFFYACASGWQPIDAYSFQVTIRRESGDCPAFVKPEN